ncbi:MAG: hypothetical protein EOO90_12090 [Pedobacter sp.]|nr:MAG: hypothetical protein EOO90_12090 [Pedobacter sp.]
MRINPANLHAVNLANFDVLIVKIIMLGRYYSPLKEDIQLEALKSVSQNAKVAIANAEELYAQYIHEINVREVAFSELNVLYQAIFKLLSAITKMNETEVYMLLGTQKVVHSQFANQERYDFLLDNFCKIIKMLKVNPRYLPQDRQLEIVELEGYYASLYLKNNKVRQIYALFCNALMVRDEVMYRDNYGLVALTAQVKIYIKYHFGWNSEEYKQISRLVIRQHTAPKN